MDATSDFGVAEIKTESSKEKERAQTVIKRGEKKPSKSNNNQFIESIESSLSGSSFGHSDERDL